MDCFHFQGGQVHFSTCMHQCFIYKGLLCGCKFESLARSIYTENDHRHISHLM